MHFFISSVESFTATKKPFPVEKWLFVEKRVSWFMDYARVGLVHSFNTLRTHFRPSSSVIVTK